MLSIPAWLGVLSREVGIDAQTKSQFRAILDIDRWSLWMVIQILATCIDVAASLPMSPEQHSMGSVMGHYSDL